MLKTTLTLILLVLCRGTISNKASDTCKVPKHIHTQLNIIILLLDKYFY